jgi:radical SAM superfamily enzyme YgiQ (UPF0313 family)
LKKENFKITKNFKITIDKEGSPYYSKISYPLRFGKFTQIDSKDYIFYFNQNNEIKIIQGKNSTWHASNEWIKRTAGGDFIYYSSAGYKGTFGFIGEYYLPCFPYSDNPIFNVYGYDKTIIKTALNALENLFEKIKNHISQNIPNDLKNHLKKIVQNDLKTLAEKAEHFHKITSGYVSVLPPDSRHADYDVIPVNVADGCLYNCGFCSIKTKKDFKLRTKDDISHQIKQLKNFYKDDISNYNSIFLGQHDALFAGSDTLMYAAKTAYDEFNIKHSNMKDPMLFMFGSVDSLIHSDKSLFDRLKTLPFYTYINIGMESYHQETLNFLKKPITSKKVETAFDKMLAINKTYNNIEITANFVMGKELQDEHYHSILELAEAKLEHPYAKGCFYISPLEDCGTTRYIQNKFFEIKNASFISSYIYLIQRL